MVKKSELLECFISPNENDRNCEAANVVDGLFIVGRALYAVAKAIDKLADTNRPIPIGAIDLWTGEINDGLGEIAKAIEAHK
jgi:hypothetical protein